MTAATGQGFTEEALALIGTRTGGQPWLVNALCYDACFRHPPGRDRARPVTAAAIQAAQERLILRRDTQGRRLSGRRQGENGDSDALARASSASHTARPSLSSARATIAASVAPSPADTVCML